MTAKLLAYRTEDGIVDAQTGEIMDETDERLRYFTLIDAPMYHNPDCQCNLCTYDGDYTRVFHASEY